MLFLKDPLTKLEEKRQRSYRRGSHPKLLEPLFSCPLPSFDTELKDLKILSLDFETTGLNPEEDSVLSMGGVEIINGQIDFTTAFHHYLDVSAALFKGSPIIHHITPEQLEGGIDPHEAMLKLRDRLKEHALLCHAAVIETSFFKRVLGLKADELLPLLVFDTLKIERHLTSFSGRTEDLSLFKIREKRGLPAYVAHNAFADAVAAAEVFLAQCAEIFGEGSMKAGVLYKLQER